jgi:hypothetical protein
MAKFGLVSILTDFYRSTDGSVKFHKITEVGRAYLFAPSKPQRGGKIICMPKSLVWVKEDSAP